MKITDAIKQFFGKRASVLVDVPMGMFHGLTCRPYSDLVWVNICELLTDLCEDVRLELVNGDRYIFACYKDLVYRHGKEIMQQIFDNGFAVIGWDGVSLTVLGDEQYIKQNVESGKVVVVAKNPAVQVVVIKSNVFTMYGKSDRGLCSPFLDYLDDVMNCSSTVQQRLGALVVASPKNIQGAPTQIIMTDDERKKVEETLRTEYGALRKQSNILTLPREMSWQTINLAGLDLRFNEKTRAAILALADRVKVPANQIAMIDANSSKALSNGSELREGDKSKYKSFRRLFENEFIYLAMELNLQVVYTITGEPLNE